MSWLQQITWGFGGATLAFLAALGAEGIDQEKTRIAALLTAVKSGFSTAVLPVWIAGLTRHSWQPARA